MDAKRIAASAVESGTRWSCVMDAYTRRLEQAVAEAQRALTRHIEPGGPSERQTINRLLEILDDQNLVGL
jgi:hypothetical protein